MSAGKKQTRYTAHANTHDFFYYLQHAFSSRTELSDNKASLLPADVEATVLFEQDVGDALAVTQQVVLDVSAPWFRADVLRDVSGETNLEVAQSTAGHKALQLLSGPRWRNCKDTSKQLQIQFPARLPLSSW